jgi:hypothetical protein
MLNDLQPRQIRSSGMPEWESGEVLSVRRHCSTTESKKVRDDPRPLEVGRSRAPGGGRKRAEQVQPGLVEALDALVEPEARGDPVSPLRWTCKSLRTLADELGKQSYRVSATLVGGCCMRLAIVRRDAVANSTRLGFAGGVAA